jgi:hypothetical protein
MFGGDRRVGIGHEAHATSIIGRMTTDGDRARATPTLADRLAGAVWGHLV